MSTPARAPNTPHAPQPLTEVFCSTRGCTFYHIAPNPDEGYLIACAHGVLREGHRPALRPLVLDKRKIKGFL